MSDDVTSLAKSINTEAPWWSTAPIWLAAGIVGVPAFIALAAGYFIAHSVTYRLKLIETYNLSELQSLGSLDTETKQRWEAVRRVLLIICDVELKSCLHEAQNKQQTNDCASLNAAERDLLQKLK